MSGILPIEPRSCGEVRRILIEHLTEAIENGIVKSD